MLHNLPAMSVSSSCEAGDCITFRPDPDLEALPEALIKAHRPQEGDSHPALSRYESTLGDNAAHLNAGSVLSSSGASVQGSTFSSRDHNGAGPAPARFSCATSLLACWRPHGTVAMSRISAVASLGHLLANLLRSARVRACSKLMRSCWSLP